MNLATDGRLLLVGEGNFSLSASLVSSGILSGPQVVTSCLDTRADIEDAHRLAASNIKLLEEAGATVLFEVDAREVHNHPEIKFFEFSRVIFNFPLADRHNVKKNRALLSEFFNSAVRILEQPKGQIMVTLCKGQGGTPADQPMRSWHDSWQVVSMATDAGLILTEVLPFKAEDYCKYECVGFRFQDKSFNTDNALIHIFEIAATVHVPESTSKRCFIQQGDEDFAVPAHIRNKLDCWSLLDKENHPLAILHEHIVASLRSHQPVSVLPSNDSRLPMVLPGYKSTLQVDSSTYTVDPDMDVDENEEDEESMSKGDTREAWSAMSSKELKEIKNRACAASAAAHSGEKESFSDTVIAVSASFKSFAHGVDTGGDAKWEVPVGGGKAKRLAQASLGLGPFSLPVYVVPKISQPQPSSGADETAGCDSGDMEQAETDVSHTDMNREERVTGQESTEQQSTDRESNSTAAHSLFHLRCSLFENIPHLLNYMKGPAVALMSGVVFHKCPISPFELPVSHEMLILSRSQDINMEDLAEWLCAGLGKAVGKDFSTKLQVQHSDCKISVGDAGCASIVLNLGWPEAAGSSLLGHVFKFDSSAGSTKSAGPEATSSGSTSEHAIGALLYLDAITFAAISLLDIRLLWSEDPRFTSQFERGLGFLSPLSTFRAFSLYPVRFVHDISFWENPGRVFDEAELKDVMRDVADDAVVKMTLIDSFENAGKTSRCYRLVFQSHDRALSYITSWKLQSIIRLKVAHLLGVTLR